MIQGKVLLLGGAGFLCRGIMRQAAAEKWDTKFTVYSRDEMRQHQCKDKYPDAKYFLGDVRDTDRLALVMAGHDVVVHAAALKHIPEGEMNVDEVVGINVYGTQSVVKAALAARVKSVIFISTDKAVLPVNAYGLSKALGEKIITEASWMVPGGKTKFVSCRYGNVIGSSGSVVPVFLHQLATQGHVTVTDPDMTRFWLSIDEAVDIIELTLMQASGTILIPTPKAMRIGDIAIAIAGQAIEITGLRPGEKMHESLLTRSESARCQTDTLFGMDYQVYYPLGPIIAQSEASLYELYSANAEMINPTEFMELVADAVVV